MADTGTKAAAPSRRNFLKIGAGVVAGAAIATVVEVPYYSSVIGGNSSSSSTTVASLQNELSSTQDQLSSTAAQLSSTQGQVSSLNNQLTSTQAQLSSVNSQLSGVSSQLSSTQQELTSANGQISTLQGQVSSASSQVSSLQSQATSLQIQIDTMTGFLTLSTTEQSLVSAIVSTIIPSDGNGPGATEAGVIYFIDRQLATDYGKNANMYMQGPFVMPNQTQPITVDGITYPNGSNDVIVESGMQYQYQMNLREFWRYGLQALQSYSNSAYGGNFETLSSSEQVQVLTDLYNNKPTSFNDIVPSDLFYELFWITWAGYFSDPLYGGNRGMVAWEFDGFNGVNQGNFYGEGYTTKQLMVMTTPIRLQPASLAQFQKGSP